VPNHQEKLSKSIVATIITFFVQKLKTKHGAAWMSRPTPEIQKKIQIARRAPFAACKKIHF
jgi:hypothetical protein